MTKQEIVNKLARKENFHEYVEVCLAEGLNIEKLNCLPEINIYMDDNNYNAIETGKFQDKCTWSRVNIVNEIDRLTEFEVNGVLMSGINNFFKHYKEITKFVQTTYDRMQASPGSSTIIWKVKPNIRFGAQWSKSYEHYEISFDCHSLHEPALVQMIGDEIINERYYVVAERLHFNNFIKESREHKLSRVLGIDLKSKRLEEERLEKERLETIKRERLENEKKEYFETCTFIDDVSDSDPIYLAC